MNHSPQERLGILAEAADALLSSLDPAAALRAAYAPEGIRSLLAFPLCIAGATAGSAVFYFRRPHRLDEADIRVATALGNLAAAALANAELYAEQRRMRDMAERAQQRL